MSYSSGNISNIVLSNEEYRKLRVYAQEHKLSISEVIRLLIDFLPESSKTNKNLSKNHPFLFHRRFLYVSLDAK
ncbi:MAG: hypothetical protein V7K55_04440 [Nostoc sp.]|uniref:hypothetical protein n=1 Tax=Nostoc sp. TaxID=1180 RepID=UPI002FFBB5AF